MLRITGGHLRSRLLRTPRGTDRTRPWTARARESVFSELRGHVPGGRIADLFAGIGTMGLEALSRGAECALLVERDPAVHALLLENITGLGVGDRATVLRDDALGERVRRAAPAPLDVVFCDPPYDRMAAPADRQAILEALSRWAPLISVDGYLVLRSPVGPPQVDLAIPGFIGPEVHRAGREMFVLYFQPERAEPV
ncbi:MAG: RsmD family RNA methyltransferase [Phycisphaeraceae bacterium]|nr:RsmD family RNA methyltransferase [Phycisphaeraceae bacterium]